MAVATRAVRLLSAKRGSTLGTGALTGGTTISGAVSIEWQHQASVAEGNSDADIGATSVDIRGWRTTGTLIVDSHDMAAALQDVANQSLGITFSRAGGTTRAALFTTVNYGDISEIEYPASDSDGPTTRYGVGFEALYGEANTKPADILTFG